MSKNMFQSLFFIQKNLLQYVLNGAKRREISGMIHWLTIKQIIPATPSNPSIPYVKRTSKSAIFGPSQKHNESRGRALQHGGFHKELTGDGAESRPMVQDGAGIVGLFSPARSKMESDLTITVIISNNRWY